MTTKDHLHVDARLNPSFIDNVEEIENDRYMYGLKHL